MSADWATPSAAWRKNAPPQGRSHRLEAIDQMLTRRRFLLTSLAGALAVPRAAETFSGSCQAVCR
jgi:hypothetical protein